MHKDSIIEFIDEWLPGGYHCCDVSEGYPIMHMSNQFLKIIGFTREEVRDRFDNKFSNLVHPDDNVFLNPIADELKNKMRDCEITLHYRICTKNGYIMVADTAEYVEKDNYSFIHGVIINASEEQHIKEHIDSLNMLQSTLKNALAREREYRLKLDEILKKENGGNKEKNSFLFNMSHDIRIPMNTIIGFTKIALNNIDNKEKVEDCLKKIEVSGNHLIGILNDMLDMARIENGQFEINEVPCDLYNYFEELNQMYQNKMKKRNLTFILDHSGICDNYVCCDAPHLNQVLFNLLDNAMKFTPEGGHVWLNVYQEESADENTASYRITVKDDGIGISSKFQERIFDEFEKEGISAEIQQQGAGLGLAIAKRILESMKGKIRVVSELGKGSEFIVTFSVRKLKDMPANGNSTTNNSISFDGKRALIVEDDELNREVAHELIGMTGIQIEEATDGREAVRMVTARQPGYYSVIFMDIQMPIMDGYEAASIIRSLPKCDKDSLPIIAMTASNYYDDSEKAINAGMNNFISKPFDMEKVIEFMNKYLRT